MIFNKSVETKDAFIKISKKIINQLGYYKHPKDLTKDNIKWMENNIKQFDNSVLQTIIKDSIKPDKPMKNEIERKNDNRF
mgnify:CR=1 FL=1